MLFSEDDHEPAARLNSLADKGQAESGGLACLTPNDQRDLSALILQLCTIRNDDEGDPIH